VSEERRHIYELFDPGKYVQAFELDGRDHIATIQRVVGEMVEGEEGRKAKKPVLYLAEWPRPLVLNKTNAKVLIGLYGPDYREWSGKRFVMFPTVVKFGKDDVDAIRFRKKAPPPVTTQQRAPKSIEERVATFLSMLKTKATEAEVQELWSSAPAEKLRHEVSPATLDQMSLAMEGRLNELQAVAKEQA